MQVWVGGPGLDLAFFGSFDDVHRCTGGSETGTFVIDAEQTGWRTQTPFPLGHRQEATSAERCPYV
jgi:hypothetical protein